jgi:hypothetical protein
MAPQRESGLDQRVRLLTAELGLSAQQQADVRRALEDQREQVRKVWADTSIPAAYRVSATRAIADRTADRIRALLTDEQKTHYVAPRKPRDMGPQDSGRKVEDWMNSASAK